MRLPLRIMPSLYFLVAFLCLLIGVLAANPISTPIIKNSMAVTTRLIAQLPPDDGEPAKIICIVPFPTGRDLVICTLKKLYRVKLNGSYSLFLDVERAFQATGRRLNYDNRAHGGVRSIAFHPRFVRNRLCYISAMEARPGINSNFTYISDPPDHNGADSVLVEFRVGKEPETVIESSHRNVFRVGMPVFDHPIKQITFRGKYLYIAHGDGSVQSASAGGGQKNDALGKILRILPKRKNGRPYTVPKSNPFVGKRFMKDEVWAYGFRNPHNLCFSKRGTLFVVDAGRDNIEEVNIVLKGKNYGWSLREGTFVHKINEDGGLLNGIRNLPKDDAKYGFEYPVVQVGHEGSIGAGFVGQAIAGACPVENGSPMSGKYYYGDFPKSGKLYFSSLEEIYEAKTRGRPDKLTQARTHQAYIYYNGKRYETLGDIIRVDRRYRGEERADIRFGQGNSGEIYWSSKTDGRLYQFTSSLPPR